MDDEETARGGIVDAWMQHPGKEFLAARRYPAELVDYLRGHGRHEMLFGSNRPAWPASACLTGLDEFGLEPEVGRIFLRDNAIRVFRLQA